MEKKRQEHFKNLPRCTKGLIFPHWPEGVCNPECGECSPSDPPSPEMVCPNCKQTIVIKKDGTISYHKVPAKDRELYGHNSKTAYCPLSGCDYQECATIPVPSPEPPEKVRETKNILEQFTIQLWRTYSSHFDHHAISWEYEPDNIKEIWRREAASIYGQLQQSGWDDLSELKHKLEEQWKWSQKALDWRESEISKSVAEARQQALKELKDYVCNECSTPNFVNVVIPKRIWDDWQK